MEFYNSYTVSELIGMSKAIRSVMNNGLSDGGVLTEEVNKAFNLLLVDFSCQIDFLNSIK